MNEKLTVRSGMKKLHDFMEQTSSLPNLQESVANRYPQPDESSSHSQNCSKFYAQDYAIISILEL